MKKDKCFEIFAFCSWGLGMIGIIGYYFISYLVSKACVYMILFSTNMILITSVFLLILGSILAYCYIKCCDSENSLTEEQLANCIRKAVNEEMRIRIDESVVSRIEEKLEGIQKQQSAFETALYERLGKVFFTKNSNIKFLQDMAASISNKDNAWTNEQIERFLKCMESINDMMKKEK